MKNTDLKYPSVTGFANMPLILNAEIKKKHFLYALLFIASLLSVLIIDHIIL
jgi:hypothetical protein